MTQGIYLKCDRCGATLGGEQVTANPEPPLGRWNGGELRRRAEMLGWIKFIHTYHEGRLWLNSPEEDLCPACAKEASKD